MQQKNCQVFEVFGSGSIRADEQRVFLQRSKLEGKRGNNCVLKRLLFIIPGHAIHSIFDSIHRCLVYLSRSPTVTQAM